MTTTTIGAAANLDRLAALQREGQSVWLDYLRRGMVRSGELDRLIANGLRGMTSNPTIFQHAIAGSQDYDGALAAMLPIVTNDAEVFESLAVEDVREATDAFRKVYDLTSGGDGFVSIEVSPRLARDTAGTVAEARRLWNSVDRPNVMIKVPGTAEGWPAIEQLLTEGINVNVTLLFSLEHYRQVAEAYMRALEARLDRGLPIDRIASVASFFVSRVDTEVDKRLEASGGAALQVRGLAGVANARLAYRQYAERRATPRWRRLASEGAKPQRLLWASTSTKNEAYSDVLYVDSLIGPETVNTLPPETLEYFEDHGNVTRTLADDGGDAGHAMEALARVGIDFDDVTRVLEDEGIAKFAASYDAVLQVIAKRRTTASELDTRVATRLSTLDANRVPARIWDGDPTVWKPRGTPEITDRLGWLRIADAMAERVGELNAFADEIRGQYERVILCGMGGSSLAPEVLSHTFGSKDGYPSLMVLDTTDPDAIGALDDASDLTTTFFLISSKSGTTQETDSFFRHYWQLTGERGEQFAAITDPGSPLAARAAERGFRHTFLAPPDIGGRYSALSVFGMVPAALIGADVGALLTRGRRMAAACGPSVAAAQNPGARLGVLLGEAARAGRDKVTFVLSPGIASFGLWIEQLIAESTGKEGKGILPVAGEPLGAPDVYDTDRVFVSLTLKGEASDDVERALDALAKAGHPVARLTLEDRHDLGAEFFRWEFATAVAGSLLGINAFDQPNVAESKQNTKQVLEQKEAASEPADRAVFDRFLAGIEAGHYLAIMAYLPPTPENDRRLSAVRRRLRDRLKVATTLGYGPRFLHSTGQLHKGGPPTGHFLQIVHRPTRDLAIPGMDYTFATLEAAQAEGDLRALTARGRPAVRLGGLAALEA